MNFSEKASENKQGAQIKICTLRNDADLTILSQNNLSVSINNILSTKILYTIVNGEIVYKKN